MNRADVKTIINNAQTAFSPLISHLTDYNPISKNIGPYNGVHALGSSIGITKGQQITPQQLWDNIRPNNPVPVVAVCDNKSCDDDGDKPIVLTVGINYTQFARFPNYQWAVCDDTGMGPKVNTALKYSGILKLFPDGIHLVATNFFPWITKEKWSQYEFNSVQEALFMDCVGYKNPYAHLDYLVQSFGNDLGCIIFHGAENAVSCLGIDYSRRHMTKISFNSPPQIIFCDNLSYPTANNIVKWNF